MVLMSEDKVISLYPEGYTVAKAASDTRKHVRSTGARGLVSVVFFDDKDPIVMASQNIDTRDYAYLSALFNKEFSDGLSFEYEFTSDEEE